jgi:CP family cyanate transporter-like MFS transporter
LGACFSLTLTVALDHVSAAKLAGVLRELTTRFQASWLMFVVTLVVMLFISAKFVPSNYAKAMNLPNTQ